MFQNAKEELRESVTLECEGRKIFGIIHRPLSPFPPSPAVLMCSGFQGSKSGKFRLFVRLAQELAKKGITVLRFDYRGSGDSEGDFSDMTLESKIADALVCLNFLARDSHVDPQRMGILGRSLGGVVAILAANRFNSGKMPLRSLVLWAPVFKSDPWRQLWEASQSNQLDHSKQEMLKNLPANIPNLEFLSQFFKLDLRNELLRLQNTPLLHLHGQKDIIVGFEHAQAFKTVREGAVAPSRFIELNQSDHDFSDLAEQPIAINETINWYLKTL